jgi:hypothetical protein
MKEHSTATGSSKYCRFMSKDAVNLPKLCLLNYDCSHCAFDQWLDHMETSLVEERSLKGITLSKAA